MIAPDTAVLFIPHPDDESYAFAGTLASLSRAGWSVRVVCLTRGEAGADRRGPNPRLGATRVAELHASCAALGANASVLGLADGRVGESSVDLSPMAEDAAVVFTLGEDGGYGHPDHLACTRMVQTARFDGALLEAVFPRGAFAPVHRALRRFIQLERTTDELGTSRDRVDHIVSIAASREQKLASIGAHRSQLRGDDPRSFLVDGLIDALLDEEWFMQVRGRLSWPLELP